MTRPSYDSPTIRSDGAPGTMSEGTGDAVRYVHCVKTDTGLHMDGRKQFMAMFTTRSCGRSSRCQIRNHTKVFHEAIHDLDGHVFQPSRELKLDQAYTRRLPPRVVA